MTRAALVLFDDDDPAVSVVGVSWPEFRLRSAIEAGAKHIVVMAGRITPEIVAAIDRARNSGVSAALVRTAADAGDLFHPEETVLLLSGRAIVDDALIERLIAADRPTLVCVGHGADPVWELIDARARWTGLARLDGAQVRATAAMVGEWDLASTLLRQAVAGKVKRMMLGETDALYRADRPEDVFQASRHGITASVQTRGGWATRGIVVPLVRQLAMLLHGRLPAVAQFAPWLAGCAIVAGGALAWSKWPFPAAAMLFLGFAIDALGAVAEQATGRGSGIRRWRERFLNAAVVVSLAGFVLPPAIDRAPLVMAIVLIVVAVLAGRLQDEDGDPPWLADVPGHVIIIGSAAAFGPTSTLVGMILALTHGGISLAWSQNRLSRALTRPR